jgi:signal transduction histidine kinase/DNA-binding response OmpR family regulator/ligand-binding sensor domain-containing protein
MKRLLFLFYLIINLKSVAQQTAWQSISIAEGLSQGMVYDLMQDKEGFIWIATKDGLNRYDGYNFKVYTHDPYNAYSISGNTCTALLQDTKGRIWIGTEKDGLNLFDTRTQKFYRAQIADKNQKNAGNYSIINIKEDISGNIWIITDEPDKIYTIANTKGFPERADFSSWIQKALFSNKHVSFLPDGHLMRSQYSYSLYRHHPTHPSANTILTTIGRVGTPILQDQKGRFWVFRDDTIDCWDKTGVKRINTFLEKTLNANVLSDGRIAIVNKEHLWVFEPDSLLKQSSIDATSAFARIPNSRNITRVILDASGNLWLGTGGFGLLKLNPLTKQFRSFLPEYSPAMIWQDQQGRTYLHANFNPSYQYFQLNTRANTLVPLPIKIADKSFTHQYLMQDKKGNFWMMYSIVGNFEKFLIQYSKDWQFMKEYPIPQSELIRGTYKLKIYEDDSGNIWLGMINGNIWKFKPTDETFTRFSFKNLLPQNGSTVETFAMYQDINRILWIGTQKGLIKTDNIQGQPQFSIYKNNTNDRKSLSNDFVSGMIDDPLLPRKYLWVSTKGGGLERLDKQNNTFEHFTEKQGLPNKVVYGVLVGDDHHLWLSTNRGISRLNPKTLIFSNFNKSDGLQEDEFNTDSYFKAPSGELLFGGINGINIFRASEINNAKSAPKVKLIGLKVNNKTIEPTDENSMIETSIEYLQKLNLAHDENLLTLEFGLMEYTNSAKNRFRYQLIGIDKDWIDAGTTRFANYAQLPAGNYTFQVMGTTNGESWSKPVKLNIRVNPPFYATWWAYLMYLMLISYIIYRFYQNQLNRVRLQTQLLYKDKEAERLTELDTIKTQFFTNISHEFRTPLTLLLGPIGTLLTKYPHEKVLPLMQRNAYRLLNLINQLLDLGKLESKEMHLNLQNGDLAKFIGILASSFSSLAENKQISFKIDIQPKSFVAEFDADKIEKILTNLLSNAFKFTPKGGKINMTARQSDKPADKRWTISIADSGIGIAPDKVDKIFDRFYQVDSNTSRNYEGTGIGLSLVRELVKLMNGEIRVESTVGKGSTFFVEIPFEQADAEETLTDFQISRQFFNKVSTLTETQEYSSDKNYQTILLVEDNEDLRLYIRSVFEEIYRIVEAVDGQDGLAKALELSPDLIISDLMMPRMDGFEMCRELKSDEKTSHIPIIMLTAKAEVEHRIEGFNLGADEYLIKPFNRAEIVARVQNLLEKQARLQAFFSRYIVTLQPDTKKVLSVEDTFLLKVKQITEAHLSESSFGVEQFSREIGMSQSQLLRKMKAISNKTVIEFLKDYRLERAAQLIRQNTGTIAEIAFAVGYENPSYFTRSFQDKFGMLPSEY